ncbi:hypothetical protein NECAME_14887 [Necator americanus]|uniref:Metallo-beta-lactamase domain-containing protein n=1 Tax=Necator americanus TaxID=51031 RepID=W2SL37_NECAM|nr:hypothetical protein NECAME_14887 [Necator americanus]ETN70248.1 hypothetical protein NECAME_14887 [Necator americanus]
MEMDRRIALEVLKNTLKYRTCRTVPYILVAFSLSSVYSLSVTIWGYAAQDDEVIPFCNPPLAKSRTNKEQRKVLRRLRVIVVIFIFSWFMAILGVNVGYIFGFSPDLLSLWQSNMVFFALICYSQTFYVCIWRSKEYRLAFVEQLQLMFHRGKKTNLKTQDLGTMKHPLIFRQLIEFASSTYTYILGCSATRKAVIIDPVLETVHRDAEIIRDLDLDLVYGLNTHVHADHVTGTGVLKTVCYKKQPKT